MEEKKDEVAEKPKEEKKETEKVEEVKKEAPAAVAKGYDGKMPEQWDKLDGGDEFMHDVVKRFGKKDANGTFWVSHDDALIVAEETWKKNPDLRISHGNETSIEAFGEAWGKNNTNGADKIEADRLPVVLREMSGERTLKLN